MLSTPLQITYNIKNENRFHKVEGSRVIGFTKHDNISVLE